MYKAGFNSLKRILHDLEKRLDNYRRIKDTAGSNSHTSRMKVIERLEFRKKEVIKQIEDRFPS